MDDEGPSEVAVRGRGLQPGLEVVDIGVRGEAAELDDLGLYGELRIVDADVRMFLGDLPTERTGGLVADHYDGVTLAGDGVLQVVQDTTALAHPAGRDHHERAGLVVQLHALLRRLGVVQRLKPEHVDVVTQGLVDIVVEALLIAPMDRCHAIGERAVDVHRNPRQLVLVEQLVEVIHHLLRAAQTEGRNDDAASLLVGLQNDPQQIVLHVGHGRMHPVAIGAFDDQDIPALDRLRVDQQGHAVPTDVTREHNPLPQRPLADFEFDNRRSQDVPRRDEPHADIGGQFMPLVKVQRLNQSHDIFGILRGIQRLDQILASPLAVEVLGVLLLNVGGILEHDVRDVSGGIGAEDRAVEPGLVESRQVAAVIDVGMGENDRIEFLGSAVELHVLDPGILAMPLKQPAVEQQPQVVRLDQVLTAGDFTRGSEKGDLHGRLLMRLVNQCERGGVSPLVPRPLIVSRTNQ